MRGYPLLFDFHVEHTYFADPARCRLVFEPDAATAAWLARGACLVRAAGHGLKAYYEAPSDGGRPAAALTNAPVDLRFNVRSQDPSFGLYTDGLPPADNALPGPVRALVFDSDHATEDVDTGLWAMQPSPAAAWGEGRRDVRADFQLVIRLDDELASAGRTYRATLGSRSATWKYLLVGAWADDRPCVVDATTGDRIVPTGFSLEPVMETLADGRSALAIRSDIPLPLAERPQRRLQLWSRTDAGDRDRVLLGNLPAASVANLAVEPSSDLVCEIFVSR